MVALAATALLRGGKQSDNFSALPVVSLPREELAVRDGRLARKSGGGPFTGVMFEKTADGRKLTEVPVKNGHVHGIARGWHDNGQLEVEETFEDGVSNGVRTRWYPSGEKRNTATIVNGVLEGPYTEWHANGQVALRMDLVHGKGQGLCESWFPDGRLTSRITLEEGKPIKTELLAADSIPEPGNSR